MATRPSAGRPSAGAQKHDDVGRNAGRPGDEVRPGTPGSGDDVCPRCGGSGKLAGTDCETCAGTGMITRAIGGA
jgi:DnaJ-class molecular chaperone